MSVEQQIRFDLIRQLLSSGYPPSDAVDMAELLTCYVLTGFTPAAQAH